MRVEFFNEGRTLHVAVRDLILKSRQLHVCGSSDRHLENLENGLYTPELPLAPAKGSNVLNAYEDLWTAEYLHKRNYWSSKGALESSVDAEAEEVLEWNPFSRQFITKHNVKRRGKVSLRTGKDWYKGLC